MIRKAKSYSRVRLGKLERVKSYPSRPKQSVEIDYGSKIWNSKYTWQLDKNHIWDKLNLETRNHLNNVYNSLAGVGEGYTIGEHTELVMNQYLKYFNNPNTSFLPIKVDDFEIMLAIHDCGKYDAIKLGDKSKQKLFNKKYVEKIFDETKRSARSKKIVSEIVSQDYIGDYIKGTNIKTTFDGLKSSADKVGVDLQQFYNLCKMYYLCDAGSYTVDAGGLESLDYLFDFTKNKIDFAKPVNTKIKELEDLIWNSSVFYHGTTSEYLTSIIREGLKTQKWHNFDSEFYEEESREKSVFITEKRKDADFFAEQAGYLQEFHIKTSMPVETFPVILSLKIPKSYFSQNAKKDAEFGHGAWSLPEVRSEWIEKVIEPVHNDVIWEQLRKSDDFINVYAPVSFDVFKKIIELGKKDLEKSQVKGFVEHESEHDFSSTQVELPKSISKKVLDAVERLVDIKDLHPTEKQDDVPHITIRYGLEIDSSDVIRNFIDDVCIFNATILTVDIFKNKDYEVLVLLIDSPELHELNSKLGRLPNQSDFPFYKPHITLCYLKKGAGVKYNNLITGLEGLSLKFDKVVFSPSKGIDTDIDLEKSQVKGFVRTRKGKREIVKPFGRKSIPHLFRAGKNVSRRGLFLTPNEKIARNYGEHYGVEVGEYLIDVSSKDMVSYPSSFSAYRELFPNGKYNKFVDYQLNMNDPKVDAKNIYKKYVNKYGFIEEGNVKEDIAREAGLKIEELDLKNVQRSIDTIVYNELKKKGLKVVEYTNPREIGYTSVSTGEKEYQVIDPDVLKQDNDRKSNLSDVASKKISMVVFSPSNGKDTDIDLKKSQISGFSKIKRGKFEQVKSFNRSRERYDSRLYGKSHKEILDLVKSKLDYDDVIAEKMVDLLFKAVQVKGFLRTRKGKQGWVKPYSRKINEILGKISSVNLKDLKNEFSEKVEGGINYDSLSYAGKTGLKEVIKRRAKKPVPPEIDEALRRLYGKSHKEIGPFVRNAKTSSRESKLQIEAISTDDWDVKEEQAVSDLLAEYNIEEILIESTHMKQSDALKAFRIQLDNLARRVYVDGRGKLKFKIKNLNMKEGGALYKGNNLIEMDDSYIQSLAHEYAHFLFDIDIGDIPELTYLPDISVLNTLDGFNKYDIKRIFDKWISGIDNKLVKLGGVTVEQKAFKELISNLSVFYSKHTDRFNNIDFFPHQDKFHTDRDWVEYFFDLNEIFARAVDVYVIEKPSRISSYSIIESGDDYLKIVKDWGDKYLKTGIIKSLTDLQKSKRVFVPAGKRKAYFRFDPRDKRDANVDKSSIEFKKWFEGSSVVDEIGKPMLMYHVSKFSGLTDFLPLSHFGTKEQANSLFEGRRSRGETPSVITIPVYLNIKNPLRIEDRMTNSVQSLLHQVDPLLGQKINQEIDDIHKQLVDEDDKYWAKKIKDWEKRKGWKLYEPRPAKKEKDWDEFTRKYHFQRDVAIPKKYVPLLIQSVESRGYDGLVYKNLGESDASNDVIDPEKQKDSYIIFHPEQVKSKFNRGTWSETEPDIIKAKPYIRTRKGRLEHVRGYSGKLRLFDVPFWKRIETAFDPNRSDVKLANRVIQEVASVGGRSLIVGGFVRDSLLGRNSKDIDIEIYGVRSDELKNILEKIGKVDSVGVSFGVFKLSVPDSRQQIDISIPRRDSKVGTGHKGFNIESDPNMSVGEAARRRDLTINSLAYDPITKKIIDEYGGIQDIKDKKLRATDSATFIEDPLRVLRVMQFSARFGFTPDENLIKLCQSIDLFSLPKERIYGELEKFLVKGLYPSIGFKLIWLLGINKILPELDELVNVEQDPEWHSEGSLFEHESLVLDASVKYRKLFNNDRDKLVFMFSILLHDIGKKSVSEIKDGKIISHGHEAASGEITRKFLERITSENDIVDRVETLVRNHMQPSNLYAGRAGKSAIRRLARKVDIPMLVALSMSDKEGRGGKPDLKAERWLLKLYKDLNLVNPETLSAKVLGRNLIPLGVQPGPEMGRILNRIYEAQLDGKFETTEEGLGWAKNEGLIKSQVVNDSMESGDEYDKLVKDWGDKYLKTGIIKSVKKSNQLIVDLKKSRHYIPEIKKSMIEGKLIPCRVKDRVVWGKVLGDKIIVKGRKDIVQKGSNVLIKSGIAEVTAMGKDGVTARFEDGKKHEVFYKNLRLALGVRKDDVRNVR